MKPTSVRIISGLLGGLLGSSCALGAEAITSYVVTEQIIGYAKGGAGFGVSPNLDVVATSFGFRGALVEGEPVQLALWDTLGQQLGSVTVTGSSPVFNSTHYETIQPITLNAGQTYYLSSCGTVSGVWAGELISTNYHNGQFTVAPVLNYVGIALDTNSAGVFPDVVVTGAHLAVGANLQFQRAPLIMVAGLQTRNARVQLDFNMWGGAPTSFTLLEATQPEGPWLTNIQAQLTTNVVGASYSFSTTASGNTRFYRVQSP